jgi:hypothetical protein
MWRGENDRQRMAVCDWFLLGCFVHRKRNTPCGGHAQGLSANAEARVTRVHTTSKMRNPPPGSFVDVDGGTMSRVSDPAAASPAARAVSSWPPDTSITASPPPASGPASVERGSTNQNVAPVGPCMHTLSTTYWRHMLQALTLWYPGTLHYYLY